MNAERAELKQGMNDEERRYNVQQMAHGLPTGLECTMVARLSSADSGIATKFLRKGERFSSVEIYSNGALNIFVRDESSGSSLLVAVIRIRPS